MISVIIILSVVLIGAGLILTSNTSKKPSVETPEVAEVSKISAEFPFESKFVEVLGSKIAYIDEGEGDPILFIHGNPTSSYLWRNIIPYVQPQGRVIALDLIGFGKSDKPDIEYTYADQIKYVEGFIEALDLKNITLVVHDWGSALGFDYASRNENNIKGLAFMEAIMLPAAPYSYDTMPEFQADFFRTLRDPQKGPELIINQNFFIEEVIPNIGTVRTLTKEEMDAYRAPFLNPESRKPILVWPNEVPIDGEPANVVKVVNNYNEWLLQTDIPKLHLYASPGALNPPEVVDFLTKNLKNYESVYVGEGAHYIQEDNPDAIGKAISEWYEKIK